MRAPFETSFADALLNADLPIPYVPSTATIWW